MVPAGVRLHGFAQAIHYCLCFPSKARRRWCPCSTVSRACKLKSVTPPEVEVPWYCGLGCQRAFIALVAAVCSPDKAINSCHFVPSVSAQIHLQQHARFREVVVTDDFTEIVPQASLGGICYRQRFAMWHLHIVLAISDLTRLRPFGCKLSLRKQANCRWWLRLSTGRLTAFPELQTK